jgi:signal transduction histidine kinase
VRPLFAFFGSKLSPALVPIIAVCAAVLVLTGYRAVVEWQNAAALVAARRAESAADLLVAALARDMRGVQQQVLTGIERNHPSLDSGVDLLHPVATAFARYPYPEAFFTWGDSAMPGSVIFYARAERQPPWLATIKPQHPFPVVVGSEPDVGQQLVTRVMQDAWQARRFSIFQLEVNGAPYQVIALLSYHDRLGERPAGAVGFMVNMTWVRQHYFSEIAEQVAQIEGRDTGIQFVVLDDHGAAVVARGVKASALESGAPQGRRTFPVAFFDPLGVAMDPPPDLAIPSWTAVASTVHDPTLGVAERSARRTLIVAIIMAVSLTVGIVLSLQAARANARLGEMRAEFVSAVTHELKTPIANLRAINETMASGRGSPEMSREYAQMGIREANRLSRLVDNLLAYARVTDVADVYSFEAVALDAVVDQALQEFDLNLKDGGFSVEVDVPEHLPLVRGDPNALGLMLNNLIDNAIRYSTQRRAIAIRGRCDDGTVTLVVTDRGVGIPQDEVQRVRQKFRRGHDAHRGGSGLGLAIVERIVSDHGGSLGIDSTQNVGTTVTITLPVMT